MDEKDFCYTGYNSNLKENSRKLRNNMTEQERHIWHCFLKNYPVKFVRQRPIGTYIADFYCSKAKLVIEIDGSQHYTDDGIEHDENRTYIINQFGVKVIRFSNDDINRNFESVCLKIDKVVSEILGVNKILGD